MVGGGAMAFTNAAVLSTGHDISLAGVLEAGQLQVLAGNSATLANVQSGTTLAVTAFGFAGGRRCTLNGTSTTVGAAQFNAARDIDVAGDVIERNYCDGDCWPQSRCDRWHPVGDPISGFKHPQAQSPRAGR